MNAASSTYGSQPVEQRRSLVPALASAIIGALLGGAAIFAVVEVANQSHLPSASAISEDQALLGGVEYGTR